MNLIPIKIGVVGLGLAGWDIHIKALRNRRDYRIAAAMDVDKNRLKEAEEEFGCKTYTGYQTFLEQSDIELVLIATKSNQHAQMSIQALKAQKHVLVEKPMAANYRDACNMRKEAKKTKKILTIHQNRRFDADFLHIQEVIKSGILGEIFMVKISLYEFSRRNDWQTLKKYGGGQINNWGAHVIDQGLLLLESPLQDIFSDLKQVANLGDAEDNCKVILRGENGRLIDIDMLVGNIKEVPAWIVLGRAGSLVSDGKTSKIRYFDPRELKPLNVREILLDRSYGNQDIIAWQEKEVPSLPKETPDFYGNLYEAIREKKSPLVLAESVCEQIRVLELCKKGTQFKQLKR